MFLEKFLVCSYQRRKMRLFVQYRLEPYRGFGKVVFVQSQSGHMYVYTGLSETSVSKGDYIATGKQLGIVGMDSFTGKDQLTFMVFKDGKPMDPAKAPRG